MKPSERQKDILDVWDNSESHILINARAGTGKTSTLLMLLEKAKHRTLFLAFNKSIQKEIEEKMKEKNLVQGKAMTMHSLGLSAIRASGKKFKIENNKVWQILSKVQTDLRLFRIMESKEVFKISYNLIAMDEFSRMNLVDDIETIKENLRVVEIDRKLGLSITIEDIWERFLERRSEMYSEKLLKIDFLDMIYLPVIWNLKIPVHPYYLFIDEAQDLNLLQHKLIDNFINQGTIRRWVSVGDPNQSIYGFAGAYSNSFELFLTKDENVVELPLDLCYRCPIDIVESANKIYDVMTSAKDYKGVVGNVFSAEDIKEGSMVICRNSTPLIQVYFNLLAQGKSSFINGNEIMNYLIRFLKDYFSDTVFSASINMEYKLEDLETEGNKFKIMVFKENYENFKLLAKNMFSDHTPIKEVIEELQSLFQEKEDSIMLCTIHKSKGLESDVVYILNEDLIPSPFAITEEELIQERNLKYVARTRAKEELYFLKLNLKESLE